MAEKRQTPKRARGKGRPFEKGNCANPGGLTKGQRKRQDDIATYVRDRLAEVRADGRSNMQAAVDASIEAAVLPDGLPDREFLFAYAFGRPVQHIAGKVDSDVKIKIIRTVVGDKTAADPDVRN